MSRVPELERALFEVAVRLEARPRARRRWRRRALPLIALLAGFAVTGVGVAAITGLLRGAPVPPDRHEHLPRPVHPALGFSLAAPRVPDPDGGPSWGIGTYTAATRGGGSLVCTVVGRVQDGQLGVVGRDGVFQNDGRFHPLNPASQTSGSCGGQDTAGRFVLIASGPPIPASGYTGAPGTAIGGCRERVNLDGPTVSPQTRRRLRNVPECTVAGERWVIAGFAGPKAVRATFIASGHRASIELDPAHNSPYLFVARAGGRRPQLTITARDGSRCKPLIEPCVSLF